MSGGRADLKTLQGQIKRDPEGYKEEFLLQWRHYHALLEIFRLKPSKDSAEFASLIDFLSHVTACYPEDCGSFSSELIDLLDKNQAVLDPALRRALAQALILIRNRGHLASTTLLPVCFRLFKCPDKRLRSLMYSHIVSDIQNCNKRHRDEKLNKSLQNFLYSQLQEDHEGCAKKSLAVLTELYRRNVWTDQRTVNVIASACFAKSSSILVAALKFFLGQDEKSGEGEDSDSEDDAEKAVAVNNAGNNVVKKEDIYKAYAKGVASSKKKKAGQAQARHQQGQEAGAKRHRREGERHLRRAAAAQRSPGFCGEAVCPPSGQHHSEVRDQAAAARGGVARHRHAPAPAPQLLPVHPEVSAAPAARRHQTAGHRRAGMP
mmetsp:Transcript_34639/g.65213  ORF Transcript_34639/g.65213 Transcript_34639/m.65213 type:complete len:376 (-) Transcript_34639:1563-2690(-)